MALYGHTRLSFQLYKYTEESFCRMSLKNMVSYVILQKKKRKKESSDATAIGRHRICANLF